MDKPKVPKFSYSTSMADTRGCDQAPSVAQAKEWFRTVILPRRKWDENTKSYRLVEMGEDTTGSELFPVFGTNLRDLSQFGIGIGLYFRMLLHLAVLMCILSAVSIPAIVYFLSADYSGPMEERRVQVDGQLESVDWRVWGTAVCTRHEPNGTTNDCPLDVTQFGVDIVSIIVLCLYCIIVEALTERAQRLIDAQNQTAADYSVVVKDPNADAWEVDEWYDYFRQFGTVKMITIAVDNHALLSSLAHKRYYESMVRMGSTNQSLTEQTLQEAMNQDKAIRRTLRRKVSFFRRMLQALGFSRDLPYWQAAVAKERQRVAAHLRQGHFPVSAVFAMFETEKDKQRCLLKTQTGLCATFYDASSRVDSAHRFRGSNVLHIEEPVEPTSVLWSSVGVGWLKRFSQQVCTFIILVGMIIAVYFGATYLKHILYPSDLSEGEANSRVKQFVLAYALSFSDFVGCYILSYVDQLEDHQTKEREQLSRLNKLLVFRGFNGAVVLYLLMDFTDTLSERNLMQIQALLIANLTTNPVLQLIGPYSRVMRLLFARSAKTQRKLDQYYSGDYWQLSERYTDITKSVGTALFFKPLLPTGLAITMLSLIVNYWVDKYCLLRKWKTPPKYDGLLAHASRYHLLIIALASLIMVGHWYNGWPFDTETQDKLKDLSFYSDYMDEDVVQVLARIVPLPREFDNIVLRIGMIILCSGIVLIWVIGVILFLSSVIFRTYRRYVSGRLRGNTKSETQLSTVPASRVKNLDGYVQTYETPLSDFAFISVPLHDFDNKYISWTGEHEDYCLADDVLKDINFANMVAEKDVTRIFGICKQYDTSEETSEGSWVSVKKPQQIKGRQDVV